MIYIFRQPILSLPFLHQAVLMAAPQPRDYLSHITTVVQPRQSSSVTYHQLFDEDED